MQVLSCTSWTGAAYHFRTASGQQHPIFVTYHNHCVDQACFVVLRSALAKLEARNRPRSRASE
jgi:hypothetical protein